MNIEICKRINNSKRNFLILNKDQCKHYPCNPFRALLMFDKLADKIKLSFSNEKILIVGFAETATAIGWRIAACWGYDFIQTTREPIKTSVFEFKEEHSHAVDQFLRKDFEYNQYDRIVFVDDEITTGKTVLSIINSMQKVFPKLKFAVASLINSMKPENEVEFCSRNIPVIFSEKLDNSCFSEEASKLDNLPYVHKEYYNCDENYSLVYADRLLPNPRHGITTFGKGIADGAKSFLHSKYNKLCGKVLVLGTEEFMYPAVCLGIYVNSISQCIVHCHSTTRSPIFATNEGDYPLKESIKLPSVYDKQRTTYLYNLSKYDKVLIVTEKSATNFGPLVRAIKDKGNSDIDILVIGEEV